MALVDMTTTTQNDDESRNQICLASMGFTQWGKIIYKVTFEYFHTNNSSRDISCNLVS